MKVLSEKKLDPIKYLFHYLNSLSYVIILVGISFFLRIWPLQSLEDRLTYLTFFPAVMISSLLGGFAGGVLATILSSLSVTLEPPYGLGYIHNYADWLGLSIFLINGVFVATISETMHRSRAKAIIAQRVAAEERSKRTAAELKKNEKYLKEAQRLANMGSWVWYPDTNVSIWTDEMFRLYGLEVTEKPPDFQQIQRYYDPGDWKLINNVNEITYRVGIPYEIDLEVSRHDGTKIWVTLRGEAVYDENDKIESLRGTLQDISTRKETEQVRNEAEMLRHTDEMKSQFLTNMSHELRTPLNAIIGFSAMMKDGYLGKLNEKQLKYTTHIFNSGEHLLSLINDILDLSKVESGKMTLDLDSISISQLLNNSLTMVKEKASKHQISLQINVLSDNDLKFYADERKIKQIVYNLLSNAVKFTEEGGSITLTGKTVAREDVGAPKSENPNRYFPLEENEFDTFYEISVQDTGIGISRSDLPQLFQVFSQVDSSLSRKYQGTGLAACRATRPCATR